MESGATGNDEDLVDFTQLLIGEPLLIEDDPSVDEMAEQGVGNRGGLLGDLLEHEVVVAALLGCRQVPIDMKRTRVGGVVVAVEVSDPVTVGGDHHGLVLTEFDGIAGVFDKGGDIGAKKHLALADSDDQRGGPPCRDDGAGVVVVGEDQGEMPLQAAHDGQHGGDEIAGSFAVLVGPGHQMNGHLGVGVAGELDTVFLKFGAQGGVVLDDAVMHHGELSGRVAVRMRVTVGRAAVGGPSGVTDPCSSTQTVGICLGQGSFQIGQSTGPAPDCEPTVTVEYGQPGRVVAPVLHPAQCVDHDIAGGPVPHIRHDSAHESPR